MHMRQLLVLAACAACAFPRPSNFVSWKSGRCLRSSQRVTGCRAAVSETEGLQLHASRAVLHLSIVPEPAPASSGIPGPGLPPGVQSLSLLGRTIGGSFAIEWDESPWGPYMEVGLLSSLVLAAGAWGAWASHVWVDSDEASKGGREVWGLPTSQCDISMQTSDEDGKVLGFGFAPLLHIGDGCGPLGRVDRSARVTVGHPPWTDKASSRVDVTLPNLSGGLYFSEDGRSGYTEVLSYPLRLQAKSWRLLPGADVSGGQCRRPREAENIDKAPLHRTEIPPMNCLQCLRVIGQVFQEVGRHVHSSCSSYDLVQICKARLAQLPSSPGL
ncbi:NDX1 [Symbiodinium sp. CCMP2592]|nr:NDX1 [Symbiodinium sp. CCMP2592]